MNSIIAQFKESAQHITQELENDLRSVRTGKAHPSVIENLIVETYGGQTKLRLMELATLGIEAPSTIVVVPFDTSTLQDIEKAILKSPLGLSPSVQGNKILIKVPTLSQEQREKMSKVARQKVEEKKEAIRIRRDDARKQIKSLFESKEIGEDEKFRLEKDLDNETRIIMDTMQSIKDKKEKEIMQI
ncbi:ribosome recycling factor [Candidatus Roizmanbacteria bacterium]|nr:ribosome recycling factor [Candidatus Roizmanbacteria bacterium]